jgi:hypothetical protein
LSRLRLKCVAKPVKLRRSPMLIRLRTGSNL